MGPSVMVRSDPVLIALGKMTGFAGGLNLESGRLSEFLEKG